jgi:hypothetical protein
MRVVVVRGGREGMMMMGLQGGSMMAIVVVEKSGIHSARLVGSDCVHGEVPEREGWRGSEKRRFGRRRGYARGTGIGGGEEPNSGGDGYLGSGTRDGG